MKVLLSHRHSILCALAYFEQKKNQPPRDGGNYFIFILFYFDLKIPLFY
jgi:hypothetical protein